MSHKIGYIVYDLKKDVYEKYPSYKNEQFLTLKEYEDMAIRIIAKYKIRYRGNFSMINNVDAISFVMEWIMFGEWKYDPSKGKSRYAFRNQNGIFAIRKWKTEHCQTISLSEKRTKFIKSTSIGPDEAVENNETMGQIQHVLDSMTTNEKTYYKLRYETTKSIEDITKEMNISKQRCSQLNKQILDKVMQCPNLRKT